MKRKINFLSLALELLVVFIGVSLGFYSDNLRQARADRENEKRLLSGLLDDIALVRVEIINKIQLLEHQSKMCDLIINYRNSPDSILKGWQNGNSSVVQIFPKGMLLSYDIAKNTGGLATIRNQSIVRKLFRFERISNDFIETESYQNTFVDGYLKPYGISTFPFPANELADDPLFKNYKKSDYLHDPKLFELTMIMREYFRGHLGDYQWLLKILDKLEKEIRAETL